MVRAFEIISMTIGFLSAVFALVNGSILTDDNSFDKEKSIELAKTVRIETTIHTIEEKILADNLLGDYTNAKKKYEAIFLDPCYDAVIAPIHYNLGDRTALASVIEREYDYKNCEDSFFTETETINMLSHGKIISNLIKEDITTIKMQNATSKMESSELPYYYELAFSNDDNYPKMKLQSFITNFISYFHFLIGGIFGGGIIILLFIIRHIREENQDMSDTSNLEQI